MPTFRQLQHLLMLAKLRNFGETARAVNLSQPALTRSIQALERDLQVQLFDRTPSGVDLTPFGEMLLEKARGIVSERDEMIREVDLIKGLEAGKITVLAGPFPAARLVSQAVGQIVAARPRLQVRVIADSWRAVTQRVLSREVDLAVAELRALGTDERLHSELLSTAAFVFYCRPAHPLAGRRGVSLEEVFGYPIVSTRAPPEFVSVLPDLPMIGGYTDTEYGDFVPAIEVDSLWAARGIIRDCDGIAVAPVSYIADDLQKGRVCLVDYHADWMTFRYGFVYAARRTLAPAVAALIEIMRSLERDQAERERTIRAAFGLPVLSR